MAQEFTIKSQDIEDKINQLLPSQGGFQPGVDFSASTMVVPIVDLTETAEGSSVRADLQTAFTLNNTSNFNVSNTFVTIVNTPGYYRVFGTFNGFRASTSDQIARISITDGITTKNPFYVQHEFGSSADGIAIPFDFVVKLEAGDSIAAFTNEDDTRLSGVTRQIADVNGNLINP